MRGSCGWPAPSTRRWRRPASTQRALAGIGLGCPGPFDEASGRIENFYTLPGWEGNDIVSPLVARFGTPVRLVNDADAALLGEALSGAARGVRIAVMLTVGTGIGGAALIDGAILRGAAGEHPEIGHLIVDPAGPDCYCGSRGCLEAFAAGPALARAGAEFGYAGAEAVFAAAESGAEPAQAIIARSADAMETAVWSLIHTFLPEVSPHRWRHRRAALRALSRGRRARHRAGRAGARRVRSAWSRRRSATTRAWSAPPRSC